MIEGANRPFGKYERFGAYHWREVEPLPTRHNAVLTARYRVLLDAMDPGRPARAGHRMRGRNAHASPRRASRDASAAWMIRSCRCDSRAASSIAAPAIAARC